MGTGEHSCMAVRQCAQHRGRGCGPGAAMQVGRQPGPALRPRLSGVWPSWRYPAPEIRIRDRYRIVFLSKVGSEKQFIRHPSDSSSVYYCIFRCSHRIFNSLLLRNIYNENRSCSSEIVLKADLPAEAVFSVVTLHRTSRQTGQMLEWRGVVRLVNLIRKIFQIRRHF